MSLMPAWGYVIHLERVHAADQITTARNQSLARTTKRIATTDVYWRSTCVVGLPGQEFSDCLFRDTKQRCRFSLVSIAFSQRAQVKLLPDLCHINFDGELRVWFRQGCQGI